MMLNMEIEELVKQMTLEEKIGMIHGNGLFCTKGVERLKIPPLIMSDGPMGVRNEFKNEEWIPSGNSDDYVTYLPCNSALAATWNRTLAHDLGQVLGEEARGRGKDVILAPGINIKRSPLCGRNFEYMSEDPYLSGEMAVPIVEGIQQEDTAACVKHFAMNNQESNRLEVEVEVNERAMREIYLSAFEKVIKQGKAYSLMGAYNRFLGEYCCESQFLLNTILRQEWQYDGMLVSDWGAVHHTEQAAKSGLDIEMSVTNNFDDYYMANPLKEQIESGKIAEKEIDKKVIHILKLMQRLHMLGEEKRKSGTYNTKKHQEKTLEIARESIILLKNEENRLPLCKEKVKKILVIGDNAVRTHSSGGGSAEIKALYEITPLMGIKKLLGGNTKVTWVPGYLADDLEEEKSNINWQADSLEQQKKRQGKQEELLKKKQEKKRKEAVSLAKEYDTVIFIGGLNHKRDSEGYDRIDMTLPYEQDILLKELLKVNPNIIVVMVSGSPVKMNRFISNTKSLIWCWYEGMEGGTALAEVLFGEVNPSGKLPETMPISHLDCSAHSIGEFPGGKIVHYNEGIFVGYRHYNTNQIPVQFPFGYGLSYTTYFIHNLIIERQDKGNLKVKVDITNTGKREGKEVIQLYIGKEDSKIERSKRELKGFEKVLLNPNETKTVNFILTEQSFSYYEEKEKQFKVEQGTYTISIGQSVEQIAQETTIWID